MSKETTLHNVWTCDWFDGEKPCGNVLATQSGDVPYGWTQVSFGRSRKQTKTRYDHIEKVFCPTHSMRGWIGPTTPTEDKAK